MNRIAVILVFMVGLIRLSPLVSQPVAKLDTQLILIGQQFHLDLQVQIPAQHTVVFPEIGDTIISQLEVLDKSPIDTVFDKNDITLKTLHRRLTLTSFDSGYFAVPPFRFVINSDTVETEPLLIEVRMVQVDSTQLADIKSPFDVNYSFIDWLKDNWKWLTGIVVALGLLGYLAYYFIKKKPLPVVIPVKAEVKLPAHVIALQKLEKLRERKLWQSDLIKQYHSELSEIIREYLENRFKIQALEQTTYEIIHSIKNVSMDQDAHEQIKQLLTLSDLVKFAKEIPLATENEKAMNFACDFVVKTKLVSEYNSDSGSPIPVERETMINAHKQQ